METTVRTLCLKHRQGCMDPDTCNLTMAQSQEEYELIKKVTVMSGEVIFGLNKMTYDLEVEIPFEKVISTEHYSIRYMCNHCQMSNMVPKCSKCELLTTRRHTVGFLKSDYFIIHKGQDCWVKRLYDDDKGEVWIWKTKKMNPQGYDDEGSLIIQKCKGFERHIKYFHRN